MVCALHSGLGTSRMSYIDLKAQRYFNVIQNRREIAIKQFGNARADEVFEAGKRFFMTDDTVGPLNALEIAMQLELEFEGKVGDIMGAAVIIHNDTGTTMKSILVGLVMIERDLADG